MLLNFGFKNFYSFKDGTEISFELPKRGKDDTCNDKLISNVLCIKGKNASGKTNVIKAIQFLHKFCINSFSMEKDKKLGFSNYFSNDEASEFYVEFQLDKTGERYKYELVVTELEVIKEALYRKKDAYSKIIDRSGNQLQPIKEFSSLGVMKLRSNASFISTGKHYEFDEKTNALLKTISDFFVNIDSNVFSYGLLNDDYLDRDDVVSKLYYNHPKLFELTKSLIIEFDTGIDNIEVLERDDETTGIKRYFPVFSFKTESGGTKRLTYYEQSHGTKTLYKQLALYGMALAQGAVLCLDEFDVHLHPDILPKLLELFTNPDVNINHAQLLFSTHDSDILDFMGRYRTYIVDKEDNESFCYRLDEISSSVVRNDRRIAPLYKSGRLGGVPKL
ncbi:ATP-binding protein [Thiomicrorhabdus sp.]|uniref:AAA family ATPase n=1 Tax=Thiomicrorhabdus sp. TaxID=2039724 RepID=UPI0029C9A7F7|nr:ATP-binding protein [Thiomicrorhabdus sp.]